MESPAEKLARSHALVHAQHRIAGLIEEAPRCIVAGMRSLLDEGARLLDSWRDMYVDLVAGSLQNLLLALIAHFRGLAGIPAADGSDSHINMRYGSLGSNLLYPTTPRMEHVDSSLRLGPSVSHFSPLNLSLNFSFDESGLPAYIATPDEPAPPAMVLLLACLCTFMETNLLQSCMEQLASRFPGGGGGGGSDQPPAFVAGELARRISAAASGLLSTYVELHGRKISLMVRHSIEATDWLHCKVLTARSQHCSSILQLTSPCCGASITDCSDIFRQIMCAGLSVFCRFHDVLSLPLSGCLCFSGLSVSSVQPFAVPSYPILNPLISQEPRAPRAVCVLLLERLNMAETEVVQLIDNEGHHDGVLRRSESAEGMCHAPRPRPQT